MHPLGKGLTVAVLFLAIGGYAVLSGVMQKRGEYQKQVDALHKTFLDKKIKLRDERAKNVELQKQLELVNSSWGKYWNAPNSTSAGNGDITLGIGEAAQLGSAAKSQNKPLPIIHVFAKEGEGSRYLGQFQLGDLQPNQATAKPTRPLYFDPKDKNKTEAAEWPSGDYRVWDMIPYAQPVLNAELQAERDMLLQSLSHVEAELKALKKHAANAQTEVDERISELSGKANAEEGSPDEVVDGLVVKLRKTEASRNELLREVDDLRRELHNKYALLLKQLSENDARAATLPKATTAIKQAKAGR